MFNSEEEYEAFLQSLHWKDGFGVQFVQGSLAAFDQVVAKVREDLPGKIAVLTLTPFKSLDDLINALPNKEQISTVFIQDVETLLHEYDKALHQNELAGWIAYSNEGIPYLLPQSHLSLQRWQKRFKIGFVFWIPNYVFKRCITYFFDWNSRLLKTVEDAEEPLKPVRNTWVQTSIYNPWRNPGLRLRNTKPDGKTTLKTAFPAVNAAQKHTSLYNQGLRLIEAERYMDAVECFDRAIEIQTLEIQTSEIQTDDDAAIWYHRGAALRQAEQYEAAIASFAHALTLDPYHDKAWLEQGCAFAALKRHEAAISCYDMALALHSENAFGWNMRGVSLHKLDRLEDAIASYERAVAVNPDFLIPWHNRGDVLNQLKRYQEAIESYDRVIAIEPNHFVSWNNRAFCLDALEQYEEALSNYDRALKIEPKYFIAWGNRAGSLEALGRDQEALASYDRALVLCPIDAEFWYSRGVLLARLGRYEAAIASYDCALALQPNDPDFAYNKACCYGLQNRVELALNWLKQAIDLDPEILDCAKTDADFDSIRQDERFQALITQPLVIEESEQFS